MDVAALVGVGGVWVAAFISRLKRGPLIPLNDPRFDYVFLQPVKAAYLLKV